MLPTTILRICVLAAALVLIPGCRSTQRTSGTYAASSAFESKPTHSRDIIRPDEFLASQLGNAYDIVVRFRPEFLQPRADAFAALSRTGAAPVVYVDRVRQGEAVLLRSIPAVAIVEIRFYRAADAQRAFGSRDAGGVIAVRTRP